jgi:hypothetical protein
MWIELISSQYCDGGATGSYPSTTDHVALARA